MPTDAPVTVVTAAATNFGDQVFAGCNRGAATQDFAFEPGLHYDWRYGQLVELDAPSPPPEIVEIFADPLVGLDVSTPDACAL